MAAPARCAQRSPRPADTRCFEYGWPPLAAHSRKNRSIAVAVDELHGEVDVLQAGHRLTRHRAGKHIAPDDDTIDARLADFSKDRFGCGDVAVNVVESGYAHCRDPSGTVVLVLSFENVPAASSPDQCLRPAAARRLVADA